MPTAGLTTRREKAGDRCSLCIQAMRALPAAARCGGSPSSSIGCSSALPAQLAGPVYGQLCMSREATLTEATNLRAFSLDMHGSNAPVPTPGKQYKTSLPDAGTY